MRGINPAMDFYSKNLASLEHKMRGQAEIIKSLNDLSDNQRKQIMILLDMQTGETKKAIEEQEKQIKALEIEKKKLEDEKKKIEKDLRNLKIFIEDQISEAEGVLEDL